MREINLRSRTRARTTSTSSRPVPKKSSGTITGTGGDGSKGAILSVLALVLAVVVLGLVIVYGAIVTKDNVSRAVKIDDAKYYAVFLSNGQVYFGKLANYNTANPELSDIYYLQLAQSPQAGTEGQQQVAEGQETPEGEGDSVEGQVLEQPGQTTDDQGLTLIKLGEELHGPEDSMTINKEQVLFIEQLKDDGKVVKAIEDYKTNKENEE